jgi:glycosyltransferase involved in cell wall biosynthesis/ubiquinone/menaquinone biosynthesis C-methylase UbiE
MRSRYFYVSSTGDRGGILTDPRLDGLTERHMVALRLPDLAPFDDLSGVLRAHEASGVVIGSTRGLPLGSQIDRAERLLAGGYRVLVYFPREQAAEVLDFGRIRSLRRHWLFVTRYSRFVNHTDWLATMLSPQPPEEALSAGHPPEPADGGGLLGRYRTTVQGLIRKAAPIFAADGPAVVPTPDNRAAGRGIYLRTDFWAPIISGGSYGHTCYVAHELSRVSEDFVCAFANKFDLIDDLGLRQMVLELSPREGSETNILAANDAYLPQLRRLFDEFRPSYIYERICLGNYLGALLSQEYGIPYIVEYNGSEISMMRSFAGSGYVHEDLFLLAEEAAFRQATLISVISDAVRDDVLARGIESDKVVVNPNGVDPGAYRPIGAAARHALRAELGWNDRHRVIGFTGTFGGWHGIDVLAEAIPRIAANAPEARFLLIGDGNLKRLVDDAIDKNALRDRIHAPGRVPQAEGARLLPAADLCVSPHASHMIDSRFFGSPTKVFEYMAMGGGIVASDLEQIGVVLSPALRPGELTAGREVDGARAVLCTPGSVDEFVAGTLELVRDPEACQAIGRNARQAVEAFYSWERHVARLWEYLVHGQQDEAFRHEFAAKSRTTHVLQTGDAYKDEAQRQWNDDACGSHYVKNSELRTLDWYLEAEAYRYGEYAPWMPRVMEFALHPGEKLLEVGGGMGTDLAQWAKNGALVTDLDLSSGHLEHAEENFRLRGLEGVFVHGDAEDMPFGDASFDVVYSNGVIHHSPHTERIVDEMYRVLRPGGRVIVMVYAENSLHYWRNLVRDIGLAAGALELWSMGEIMSRAVELGSARPLVKVYDRRRLDALFGRFAGRRIVRRQITLAEIPRRLERYLSPELAGRLVGWNLIVKGYKPGNA